MIERFQSKSDPTLQRLSEDSLCITPKPKSLFYTTGTKMWSHCTKNGTKTCLCVCSFFCSTHLFPCRFISNAARNNGRDSRDCYMFTSQKKLICHCDCHVATKMFHKTHHTSVLMKRIVALHYHKTESAVQSLDCLLIFLHQMRTKTKKAHTKYYKQMVTTEGTRSTHSLFFLCLFLRSKVRIITYINVKNTEGT